MKSVIMAGGFGTRISEESLLRPKPMIEIGGHPILWHIMKIYSHYGIKEFIICLGYKGYIIKEYFANYHLHMRDVTIDMKTNQYTVHNNYAEDWKVTLVDTGDSTMTGGRLKRLKDYLKDDEVFCMTYGDGVGDVDIGASIEFHKSHGKLATLTATQPPERFGILDIDKQNTVVDFKEKFNTEVSYINGGFFVLSPKVLDYIDGDDMPFEREPLERLANEEQLKAYTHKGFWQCMDTLRDKNKLEELWDTQEAPWKCWS